MLFGDPKELSATQEAMQDPQVGDLFTEMCTFWLYVIHRDGNQVATVEANQGNLPDEGVFKIQSCSEFQERFGYSVGPGYWIRLVRRGENVDGWYERCLQLSKDDELSGPDPAPLMDAMEVLRDEISRLEKENKRLIDNHSLRLGQIEQVRKLCRDARDNPGLVGTLIDDIEDVIGSLEDNPC